jgi:hypothetical protein
MSTELSVKKAIISVGPETKAMTEAIGLEIRVGVQ